MDKSYDAIVVGAGPGGACCAALLAQRGFNVLVLEKNPDVGGKGMTITSHGFKSERWPMGGVPTRGGAWLDAFKALGIESKLNVVLKPMVGMYRRSGGEWMSTVTDMANWSLPDPNVMFDEWGLEGKARETALRVLAETATMDPEKLEALDDVAAHDFLSQYEDLPPAVYGYFAYMVNAANVGLVELVPMSEVIRGIKSIMEGPLGYPAGGYGRLTRDMTDVVEANGGKLITGARVERIVIEDGRGTGVATKDGTFKAPVIISNAGIHPTVLKLVGEEYFDRSYVNYVKDLLPSLGFTAVHYVLKEPFLEHALYQIWSEDSWWNMERYDDARAGNVPKDVTLTVTVPANYDPDMGVPGKQLVLAGTNCSPDPDSDTIQMLWDKTDAQVEECFPGIADAIETKYAYAGPAQIAAASRDAVMPGQGGEAVGVGVTVGQSGKHKPSAKSPIPGLFYVGFDAGSSAGLMGTHQAIDSAMRVAPAVHLYAMERRQAVWD